MCTLECGIDHMCGIVHTPHHLVDIGIDHMVPLNKKYCAELNTRCTTLFYMTLIKHMMPYEIQVKTIKKQRFYIT